MNGPLSLCAVLLPAALLLSACQGEDPAPAESESAAAQPAPASAAPETAGIEHELQPLPGVQAPLLTRKETVRMQTTAGDIVIDVYPEAAPNAAERFLALVRAGFYDDTPVSRVVPGFVAQFGINWREGHRDWQNDNFADDPTLFSLDPGTLAFAKAGPDTNSTQVFINYRQNNQLAVPEYNFTVFGKVVEGMEVVEQFTQVGDPGGGLDQGRLWNDGEAYLASLPQQPTMIESAEVVE